ncbi:hypothetical protein K504DRAFT_495987 [Pleomassaria siparia CBS 279.74]|uniref:RNI-like protein n=1 Tax=Pleomassaria siparia CBS 279.74 TaxID=1314801 RepID=A0A6G1JQX6_9PLEO|nr:hypothetical protein K504DRAFT_495987 [Pleomassaria siparia CBS 279.74]
MYSLTKTKAKACDKTPKKDPASAKKLRQYRRRSQKHILNTRLSKTKKSFPKNSDWKPDALGFVPGIKEINFGPTFAVEDLHLDAIATADPAFCERITTISLGARQSHEDIAITDDAVTRLVAACPNLITLRLDAAIRLTGSCLPSILQSCNSLTTLAITGNNKNIGNLADEHIEALCTNPNLRGLAPKLKSFDVRLATANRDELATSSLLTVLTAMEGRKGKLEVIFQHPTSSWEQTFKNGEVKQEVKRMQMDAFIEALEYAQFDAAEDSDDSMDSEMSAMIHAAF